MFMQEKIDKRKILSNAIEYCDKQSGYLKANIPAVNVKDVKLGFMDAPRELGCAIRDAMFSE